MNTKAVWEKIDELKKHPELAGSPGYDVAQLRQNADAIDWFYLMTKQGCFAPNDSLWWYNISRRSDLPWAQLLAAQPQLEKYCCWESVNRLELVKLFHLAPEIFKRNFPEARPWDLYAFLTPTEKMMLLYTLPEIGEKVDWQEWTKNWGDAEWLILLSRQPQFEKYFDWSTVEQKPSNYWDQLLARQPQFSCHCNFALLHDWQIKKIQKHQPQLFAAEGIGNN